MEECTYSKYLIRSVNIAQSINTLDNEFDDKLWQEDLQKKSSLLIYRKYKEVICDEHDLYDNLTATTTLHHNKTLFRAKTGTLTLKLN